jgi:hypothetical protein
MRHTYIHNNLLTFTYTFDPKACQNCNDITGVVCVLGLLQVNPGYWAKIEPSGFVSTLQCAQNRCPGTGGAVALALQLADSTGNSSNVNAELQQCGSTRLDTPENFMCGICAGDNFQDINGECVKCSETNAGLVVLLLVICAVFVTIIYYLSAGKQTGTVSVVLYYTQIALLIAGPTASWTTWVSAFALSPSNSNYFSSCIFKAGMVMALTMLELNQCLRGV